MTKEELKEKLLRMEIEILDKEDIKHIILRLKEKIEKAG